MNLLIYWWNENKKYYNSTVFDAEMNQATWWMELIFEKMKRLMEWNQWIGEWKNQKLRCSSFHQIFFISLWEWEMKLNLIERRAERTKQMNERIGERFHFARREMEELVDWIVVGYGRSAP